MTATLYQETSIDDLLETDPRIIIRKLLQALPDENDALAQSVNSPAIESFPDKADDTDYNGDSDFDSTDELIFEIFGDETPTPYFIPRSENAKGAAGPVQTPTPSSFYSSPVSIDDGYDGDDDFDAIDDLADSIFGDVTPTKYFFPALQEENNTRADNPANMVSTPQGIEDVTPSLSESVSDDSDNDKISDADLKISDGLSRSSSDEEDSGESDADEDSVDPLREMANAISNILVDLEVLETYERVEGEDFCEFLVEVRPTALKDAPTLVAYRGGCDQITVPLEMAVNQFAASIIREMAEAKDLVAKPSGQIVSSIDHVGLLHDGDVFASSSEVENDSDFESCDEEELIALIPTTSRRKRGRDDNIDFEDDDNDDDDDAMRTPSNSRHPRKRRRL